MAFTPQSIIKRYIIIKAEDTPGTYNAPAAAQHKIRFRDIEVTLNNEVDNENSKYASGNHAEDQSVPGVRSATIKAKCRMTFSGTDETVPTWYTAAQSCGQAVRGWDNNALTGVAAAVDGVCLLPRGASDDTTYSIDVYDTEIGESNITRRKFKGAIGNPVFYAEGIGKPWELECTWQAAYYGVSTGAAIEMSGTATETAEPFLGNTLTIGTATSGKISSARLDAGNVIQPIYNQADASGISHFVITERHPRLSINPLSQHAATKDYQAEYLAATSQAVTIASTNMVINAPATQILPPALASREGLVAWDLNLKCKQNGYEDDLTDSNLTIEDTYEIRQGDRA